MLNQLSIKRDNDNLLNRVIQSDLANYHHQSISEGISIKYVVEGKEVYIIDGKEIEVQQGQFLIVNHHKRIEASIQGRHRALGICLYIDPSFVNSVQESRIYSTEKLLEDPKLGVKSPIRPKQLVYPLIGSVFQQFIYNTPRRLSNWDKEQVSPFFYDMAELLISHEEQTDLQINNINATRKSTRLELFRRLGQSKEFIHAHYDRKLSVKEIAQSALLSEYHFIRSFKQAFGQTPAQYIQYYRVEKACELLKNKKLAISEIALKCGFSDYQYFSKCFKKLKGVPPSKYA